MQKFNEWMNFRTQNAQEDHSDFQFSGTYDPETIPDLTENSEIVDAKNVLEIIPDSYKTQFSDSLNLIAGKSFNEDNKEVVWITIKDQNITYLFEKK